MAKLVIGIAIGLAIGGGVILTALMFADRNVTTVAATLQPDGVFVVQYRLRNLDYGGYSFVQKEHPYSILVRRGSSIWINGVELQSDGRNYFYNHTQINSLAEHYFSPEPQAYTSIFYLNLTQMNLTLPVRVQVIGEGGKRVVSEFILNDEIKKSTHRFEQMCECNGGTLGSCEISFSPPLVESTQRGFEGFVGNAKGNTTVLFVKSPAGMISLNENLTPLTHNLSWPTPFRLQPPRIGEPGWFPLSMDFSVRPYEKDGLWSFYGAFAKILVYNVTQWCGQDLKAIHGEMLLQEIQRGERPSS